MLVTVRRLSARLHAPSLPGFRLKRKYRDDKGECLRLQRPLQHYQLPLVQGGVDQSLDRLFGLERVAIELPALLQQSASRP